MGGSADEVASVKFTIFVPVPNLGLQRVSNYQACSTNEASVKTEAFVFILIDCCLNCFNIIIFIKT